jgi:hypothetical protein
MVPVVPRASGHPRVELLWWEGCPSWGRALDELRAAMSEQGLDPAAIELHEVPTDQEAQRTGFVGSPTIRIDGRDIQAPGADEPVGLTCRVYRLRDGRISPTPDPEDVRDALRGAMREGSPA